MVFNFYIIPLQYHKAVIYALFHVPIRIFARINVFFFFSKSTFVEFLTPKTIMFVAFSDWDVLNFPIFFGSDFCQWQKIPYKRRKVMYRTATLILPTRLNTGRDCHCQHYPIFFVWLFISFDVYFLMNRITSFYLQLTNVDTSVLHDFIFLHSSIFT